MGSDSELPYAKECLWSGCHEWSEMGKPFCSEHLVPPATHAPDQVKNPQHYTQGDIECIDAITEAVKELKGVEAFCVGNAIKYLWRHDMKGGTQDLEKAKWYIDRTIAERTKRGAK